MSVFLFILSFFFLYADKSILVQNAFFQEISSFPFQFEFICPSMYCKEDFEIIGKLFSHHIGKSYIVQATKIKADHRYELRMMHKETIVELDEKEIVMYEKRFRPQIRHNFLVNVVYTFQDIDNLYLVSELPSGGYFYSLLNELGRLSVEAAKFYIAEMLIAINYLHKKGRCYYHLMPGNIMLDQKGHIKLKYDYMNLCGMDDDTYDNNAEYIGVEYVVGKSMTYRSDYWSLGTIMYEILFGYSAFGGCTVEETIENVRYAKFDIPPEASLETEDLLSMLLCSQTFMKMNSSHAFLYVKNHRFFAGIDWAALEKKEVIPPLARKINVNENVNPIPLPVYAAYDAKKRSNDGYLKGFSEYSFFYNYKPVYKMDLN